MRRLAVALLTAACVVAVGGCARDEARASGVVERWLQAVSDQGRSGLEDDARERAAEYGDPSVAAAVVPPNAEEDERHFSDLEVGKADEGPLGARVPFRVTQRLEGGDTEDFTATAVLARTGDRWRVTDVEPGVVTKLPSEGGEPPARAAASQWGFALVLGILLTVMSVVVIEAQPRSDIT